MTMTDPISDLLTRIRNANHRKMEKVDIPASKMKGAVLKILKDEGYITNYKSISDRKQGILRVYMRYTPKGERIIKGLKRVSRPGSRIYKRSGEIRKVFNGLGISIISTSKGLMIDRKCRETNTGGEVVCEVW